MKSIAAVIAAVALALSAAVHAGSCPTQMKAIDDAMAKNPNLSSEQAAEVRRLRAEGEALHKAGKHAESEAALGQASQILGI